MGPGFPDHLMYKNRLQEFTQKAKHDFPSYQTVNEGFQHAPRFRSTVTVAGKTYSSPETFSHKKEAEQDAAKVALESIRDAMKENGVSSLVQKDDQSQTVTPWRSILYEFAVKTKRPLPKFEVFQKNEPRPIFKCSVFFDGKTYAGEVTKSRTEAQQLAARVAVQSLLATGSPYLRQIVDSKNKATVLMKIMESSSGQRSLAVVKKPDPPKALGALQPPPTPQKKRIPKPIEKTGQKKIRGPPYRSGPGISIK